MAKNPDFTYNFEIEDILNQFYALLDGVMVLHYDVEDGKRKVKTRVPVKIVHGTKDRALVALTNTAKNYTLPLITGDVTGIKVDTNRLAATYTNINRRDGADVLSYKRPIPVTISLKLSIITKYKTDLYQIFANICSACTPYMTYSWAVPTKGIAEFEELRNIVRWDYNFGVENKEELKETDEDKFIGNMGFTIEGWIFPTAKMYADNIIYDIGTTVYAAQHLKDRMSTSERFLVNQYQREVQEGKYNNPREWSNAHARVINMYREVVSGERSFFFRVRQDHFNEYNLMDGAKLVMDGYNLEDAKVLFCPVGEVSGLGERVSATYQTPIFPESDTLEPKNPTISGYIIEPEKTSQNSLTLVLKNIQYQGDFDLIIFNDIDFSSINSLKINLKGV